MTDHNDTDHNDTLLSVANKPFMVNFVMLSETNKPFMLSVVMVSVVAQFDDDKENQIFESKYFVTFANILQKRETQYFMK